MFVPIKVAAPFLKSFWILFSQLWTGGRQSCDERQFDDSSVSFDRRTAARVATTVADTSRITSDRRFSVVNVAFYRCWTVTASALVWYDQQNHAKLERWLKILLKMINDAKLRSKVKALDYLPLRPIFHLRWSYSSNQSYLKVLECFSVKLTF